MDWSKGLRRKGVGTEIDVHVVPGASRSEMGQFDQWRKRFSVKVTEPPEDGRANREVERVLAEHFNCKAEVVKGHTGKDKTVFLDMDLTNVKAKLEGGT